MHTQTNIHIYVRASFQAEEFFLDVSGKAILSSKQVASLSEYRGSLLEIMGGSFIMVLFILIFTKK